MCVRVIFFKYRSLSSLWNKNRNGNNNTNTTADDSNDADPETAFNVARLLIHLVWCFM